MKPHFDPWITTRQDVVSTSFATSWNYAKWYSDKHQNPEDPLKWEYGDSTGWFSYYMFDTVITEMKNAFRHPLNYHIPGMSRRILGLLGLVKKDTSQNFGALNKLQKWIGDITHRIDSTTSTIKILKAKTDIPGNHGAILTYARDDIVIFDMGPGQAYEQRTMVEISSDKPLALAVPLNRVEEYQRKVEGLGLHFQVLAIEAVDYHLSQFPLHQLTSDLKVDHR